MLRHSTLMAPGAIIGTLNGRPVYAIAGADGPPAPAPAPAPEPAPAPPAPADPAPAPTPEPTKDGDLASLPDWAQKAIKDARAEAGKARTTAKQTAAQEAQQQLVQQIGKTLGLVKEGEPADPAKLTEQLQQTQTEAASARIELQVHRTAIRLGADAERLLDSRAFCDKVDALEPKDAQDFAKLVEAQITDAVKRDPSLKAGQAPARSGGAHPGGPGGTTPITQEQLDRMSPAEISKALDEGKLAHLL